MASEFVSDALELPEATATFARADLAFYDVDHSGASYQADVYLIPADTDPSASIREQFLAGRYFVFGHGGCFGELGHCDVPSAQNADPFDLRPEHQLTPVTKTVEITDALKRLLSSQRERVVVVVTAHTNENDSDDVLGFSAIRLLTYK